MIVEIDLFSGRPNPSWEVDDGVRREVLDIEAGLTSTLGAAVELPGLGYRGLVYLDRRAFGGLVVRDDGTILDDPGRKIERLLLGSIPAELDIVRERIAALGIY